MREYNYTVLLFLAAIVLTSCTGLAEQGEKPAVDSLQALQEAELPMRPKDIFPENKTQNRDTFIHNIQPVNTGSVQPDAIVAYAETLVGVPYVYASTDPNVGFDCSGFITHVFGHFNVVVPRSSIDFTTVGETVAVTNARRGDLILFTGTDGTEKGVGHMGLVVANNVDGLSFIHATSGKAMSVTITPLNDYYKKRFVRISRIFP